MASSLLFHELCQHLETIVNIKKKRERSIALKRFMNEHRIKVQAVTDQEERRVCLYPIARLLLPQLDRERGSYGIKESKLAQRYIRVLGLPKDGDDARRLLNFRAPASNADLAGDFAAVACHVLQHLVRTVPSKFTVGDVNKQLDNLALYAGNNNTSGVDSVLQSLLQNTSVQEQKWLIRIILKSIKLNLGKTSIFNSIHVDAEKLFDVCSSLKNVCEKLSDVSLRMNEVEINLGSPFSPMLSDRLDMASLDKLDFTALLCETKLDGERMQVHKLANGQFKYYSRRSVDYTSKFGTSATDLSGSLTQRLCIQLSSSAQTFILDGEMVAWDTTKNFFKYKGENTDVKFLKVGGEIVPCFCVFDVLYYNGQVLSNKPLKDRLDFLPSIFNEEKGVIMNTKRWIVNTKEDIMNSLNDAIDALDEGIMIKNTNSTYKTNERKAGWWKLKPEYNNMMMENLDLVIVGGFWGGGGRSGIISQFLLGIANRQPEQQGEVEFHTICRVGSGYTRGELGMVMNKLQRHWQNTQPQNIKATGTEKPDVWIDPKKTVVLEIKASEIVQSNAYYTRCTLRFPRTEKPRFDRDWKDCLSVAELEDIKTKTSRKLVKQYVTTSTKKITRRKPQVQIELPLASQFQPADVSGLTQESNIFRGKVFFVVTGAGPEHSKQDLEKLIAKHGGTLVQNPVDDTWAVISESRTNLRVKNFIRMSDEPLCDVIRSSWLLKCVNQGRFDPPEPEDLFYTCLATKERIANSHDKFGDSFTKPATTESIKFILDHWPKKQVVEVDKDEMWQLEEVLLYSSQSKNIFRPYTAYFDQYESLYDSTEKSASYWQLELVKKIFCFYGGRVLDTFQPDQVNVVVLDPQTCSSDRITELRRAQRPNQMFHVLSKEWIKKSREESCCLPENMYCLLKNHDQKVKSE